MGSPAVRGSESERHAVGRVLRLAVASMVVGLGVYIEMEGVEMDKELSKGREWVGREEKKNEFVFTCI